MDIGDSVEVVETKYIGQILSKTTNGWYEISGLDKKVRLKALKKIEQPATVKAKVEEIEKKMSTLALPTLSGAHWAQQIPGLFYIPNIIEGDAIFEEIDESHYFKAGTSEHSRLVIQYGLPFLYQGQKKEDVVPRMIFPDYIKILRNIAIKECEKLALLPEKSKTNKKLFNQCIINKYEPGEKIGAHVDLPSYGPVVACFSILSGITMVFKKNDEIQPIYVEKNSLYIMSGPARTDYTHEIKGVKSDLIYGKKIARETRISITFRSNENDETNTF